MKTLPRWKVRCWTANEIQDWFGKSLKPQKELSIINIRWWITNRSSALWKQSKTVWSINSKAGRSHA